MNRLFNTTFEVQVGGDSQASSSIAEAGISNDTAWSCKPDPKSGFFNYNIITQVNPENAQQLTVSILPGK